VQSGEVSAEAVQDSARRVLRLIARVGAFEDPLIPEEQAINYPAHCMLIQGAGAEGIVLLKNDGILPLDQNNFNQLALIGPNVLTAQIMGGGSAQVNAHHRITPFEAISAQVGDTVELRQEVGAASYKLLPLLRGQVTVEYFNSSDLSGERVAQTEAAEAELMWFNQVAPGVNPDRFSARLSTHFTPDEDGEYHFSLVSGGLSRLFLNGKLLVDNWSDWKPGGNYFGTGSDEVIGAAELQAGQPVELTVEYAYQTSSTLGIKALRVGVTQPLGDAAIERAVQLAAEADVALLFVGLTGEWDTEGQDRPHMDLVGRQNELIERVAAVNPKTVVILQTGGPVTMPWLDQVGAVLEAWYPGQECGNSIVDVLLGTVNPSGKLPQTFPARLEDNPAYINYPGENGRVRYGEGIFVGYRYYEKKRVAPLFPFGYGLSYTSFAYDDLQLSAAAISPDDQLTVSINITNTGQRAGKEVVQLYVQDVVASVARPPKELKGFAKVALEPGQSKRVTLTLDRQSLAYWDDLRHAWVAEAGEFRVLVGSSSADIHAEASFELRETAVFGEAVTPS
jgi:beta-glucosidase